MASNTRDRDLALQAAEAALADAEVALRTDAAVRAAAPNVVLTNGNNADYWETCFVNHNVSPCTSWYIPDEPLPTTGGGASPRNSRDTSCNVCWMSARSRSIASQCARSAAYPRPTAPAAIPSSCCKRNTVIRRPERAMSQITPQKARFLMRTASCLYGVVLVLAATPSQASLTLSDAPLFLTVSVPPNSCSPSMTPVVRAAPTCQNCPRPAAPMIRAIALFLMIATGSLRTTMGSTTIQT